MFRPKKACSNSGTDAGDWPPSFDWVASQDCMPNCYLVPKFDNRTMIGLLPRSLLSRPDLW